MPNILCEVATYLFAKKPCKNHNLPKLKEKNGKTSFEIGVLGYHKP